jgi:uncharacterized membrane protein YphA (DoxX/SURF4 family)
VKDNLPFCPKQDFGNSPSSLITMSQHYWTPKLLCLPVAGRLVLAVHFASEAVDKLLHWSQWVDVIQDAGFPVPSVMLLLVVALLLTGTPLFVTGFFLRWAVGILLLFQIPTTLFFETTWYEQADSISVMGGLLLALALDELQKEVPPTEQEPSGEGALLLDPGIPDQGMQDQSDTQNDNSSQVPSDQGDEQEGA